MCRIRKDGAATSMTKRALKKRIRIDSLRPNVWHQLRMLPHLKEYEYPAAATLVDGTHHDCVLFFEVGSFTQKTLMPRIGSFGRHYRLDSDGIISRIIEPRLVSMVHQSTISTPIEIEKAMREAPAFPQMGSEGLVTILFSDGKRARYDGPYYAFIELPSGYSPKDIVKVKAFDKDEEVSFELPGAKPMLCLFKRPDSD